MLLLLLFSVFSGSSYDSHAQSQLRQASQTTGSANMVSRGIKSQFPVAEITSSDNIQTKPRRTRACSALHYKELNAASAAKFDSLSVSYSEQNRRAGPYERIEALKFSLKRIFNKSF